MENKAVLRCFIEKWEKIIMTSKIYKKFETCVPKSPRRTHTDETVPTERFRTNSTYVFGIYSRRRKNPLQHKLHRMAKSYVGHSWQKSPRYFNHTTVWDHGGITQCDQAPSSSRASPPPIEITKARLKLLHVETGGAKSTRIKGCYCPLVSKEDVDLVWRTVLTY